MTSYRTSVSSFSMRGTQGKRSALLAYSLLALGVMLGLAHFITSGLAQIGEHMSTLALADVFVMFVLGAALFVVVPAAVAAHVGEERRSGTLDLLRTAPLSPTSLALGFLAGVPAPLFLLVAAPFAFHCACGLLGVYPFAVLPQSVMVLGSGCVMLMLVAMLGALTLGHDGGGATPIIVAGIFGVGTFTAVGMASDTPACGWAFMHPAGALAVLYSTFEGPFQHMLLSSYRIDRIDTYAGGWTSFEASFATLVYVLSSGILLVAARRALSGDPPARFTKYEAIALFAVVVCAVFIPLRAAISADELEHGHLGGAAFALNVPFVLLVAGATPTARGYGEGRAPQMSDRGAPFLAALLMIVVGLSIAVVLYGSKAVDLITVHMDPATIGFLLVLVSCPIYALFASTRLSTPAARLGFWAVVAVEVVLQIPAWLVCSEHHFAAYDIGGMLAECGVAVSVLLPLIVAWRQRVGDARLRVSLRA